MINLSRPTGANLLFGKYSRMKLRKMDLEEGRVIICLRRSATDLKSDLLEDLTGNLREILLKCDQIRIHIKSGNHLDLLIR